MFENYPEYEFALAATQIFLAMLGMGALLSIDDFISELKQPKPLLIGLVMLFGFVPLLTYFLCASLSAWQAMPVGIMVGILMIATMPGGTLSNIFTYLAHGNITLSVSLTAIATVLCLLTIPLFLGILLPSYLPSALEMPVGKIARDIFVGLLLPLVIGMLIKKHYCHSAFIAKWSIRGSLVFILLMAVGAGGSGRLDPQAYGVMGVMALVIFGVSVQVSGLLATLIFKLKRADGVAIIIETTFRNVGLGVAIKASLFPAQMGQLDPIGDAVFFTLLLYGGVSMGLSFALVSLNRLSLKKSKV